MPVAGSKTKEDIMIPVAVNSGIATNVVGEEPPKLEGNVPLPNERVPGTSIMVSRWHLSNAEVERILFGHDVTIIMHVPEGTPHPTISVGVGVVPDADGKDGYIVCKPIEPGIERLVMTMKDDPALHARALERELRAQLLENKCENPPD